LKGFADLQLRWPPSAEFVACRVDLENPSVDFPWKAARNTPGKRALSNSTWTAELNYDFGTAALKYRCGNALFRGLFYTRAPFCW
jgi:hypothetical protein